MIHNTHTHTHTKKKKKKKSETDNQEVPLEQRRGKVHQASYHIGHIFCIKFDS